ncbi:MAG TPA: hypothetical protein VLJ42_09035 [Solirubrobacteraceae bacterium]|nr:hypothetical protein [Solirubrobacteraceae bacterium]
MFAALAAGVLLSGCDTRHPPPLDARALAEAQTFPYYRIYWVGPKFDRRSLTAVDGRKNYTSSMGASVYYGDCVRGKGILGGGSCLLPLQVTTVIYRLHSNANLGAQRNAVIRGVPAVIYDGGRSIELYSGRVAIDVFSDTFERALAATHELRPLNAPDSSSATLPAPVFCPGLSGPISPSLSAVLAALPRRVCQRTAAAQAALKALRGSPPSR